MNWPDFINGVFECGIGVFAIHSCMKLYHDKRVQGFSPFVTPWVTAWGFWNLYYYPSLDQWLSFAGGCVIVTANSVWLAMQFYYWRLYAPPKISRGPRLAYAKVPAARRARP